MRIKINILIILIFLGNITSGFCSGDSDLIAGDNISSDKSGDSLRISFPTSFSPFTFLNAEGNPSGMLADVWALWAQKTGVKIEFFHADTWKTSVENVKSGKADIHAGLFHNSELYEGLNFSQPFYEAGTSIFYYDKNNTISDVSDFFGQTVGAIRGSVQEAYLKKIYPNIYVAEFDSREKMIYAARNGEIKGLIVISAVAISDISRLGFSGEFNSLSKALYSGKLCAGVLKDNNSLLALIDKGFDLITTQELAEIEKRWIPDPEKRYYKPLSKIIRLTDNEQAWIKLHKTVRVGTGKVFPPFHFIENNKPVGIIPDYIHIISERTGIRFELIPIEWNNIDIMTKNRKIDLHLSNNLPYRKEWMNFTTPMFQADFGVVSRNDMPFVSNLSSLKGKTVAVLKDIPIYKQLLNDYPEIIVYPANDTSEALEAVLSRKADVYVGSVIGAAYLIQKNHLNLKIVGRTNLPDQPMLLAIRNDWGEAASIISKAIASISKGEHDAIIQKWLPVRFEYAANRWEILKRILMLSVVFVFILGISLFWNRRLAKEIEVRKCAEEELLKFKTVFDNANFGMAITNSDGTLNYINEYFAIIHGYTRDELIGQNLGIFYTEKQMKDVNRLLISLQENSQFSAEEVWHKHRDGKEFPMLMNGILIRDSQSRPLFMAFTAIDITDRKRAEEALRNSEAFLSVIYKNSDLGIFVVDVTESGEYTYAGINPAHEKLIGIKNSEIVGKRPDDLIGYFSNDVIYYVKTLYDECIRNRKIIESEYYIPELSEQGWWMSRLTPLIDEKSGRVFRLIGSALNIDERKKAEEEIRHLNEELEDRVRRRTAQLEAANKELESFSYSVSHDLRAPLRSIDGWSLALAEDCADILDETGKKYLVRIREEVFRMGNLIEDMLKLSRLTRYDMRIITINFSELAEKVAFRFRELDSARIARVIIQPDMTVEADVGMMEIVLTNLIGNAWKFTGKIPETIIEFGKLDTEDRGKQIFFVRDNGAGFDMTYASKLFGAFQRLHKVGEFPGTGIGLAIVQRIIHRHGGRVWAEAEVNKGATFYFTL